MQRRRSGAISSPSQKPQRQCQQLLQVADPRPHINITCLPRYLYNASHTAHSARWWSRNLTTGLSHLTSCLRFQAYHHSTYLRIQIHHVLSPRQRRANFLFLSLRYLSTGRRINHPLPFKYFSLFKVLNDKFFHHHGTSMNHLSSDLTY